MAAPSADDFAALARSSPWRWTTLRFTARWPSDPWRSQELRAWLRRPDRLRVETVDPLGGSPDCYGHELRIEAVDHPMPDDLFRVPARSACRSIQNELRTLLQR
jgi:hypothetical protein